MKRPSFDEIYMRLAFDIARRSTCARLRVGCVITDDEGLRVLAIGYNGNYKGGLNMCESEEPGNCKCLHAETNSIIKLNYNEPTKVAYITHLPCKMCAKQLINAGISKIYYCNDYRKTDSIELFRKVNIPLVKLEIDGSNS